jgi:hypothetical protein
MRARVFVCVALSSASASAQRDAAAAQAIFDQARDAMKRGDYATACPRFAESQRLDAQPGTLANLAMCEEKAGQIASAWTHAREAVEQLPATDARVPPLRTMIARVQARLPRLAIKVRTPLPSGAVMKRDDVELGAAAVGEPLPLDPGEHTVTLRAPGRTDATRTVTVAEGATTEVIIEIGEPIAVASASPVTATPAPATPNSSDVIRPETSSRRSTGYIALAAGGIGGGVALISGIVLAEKQATVKASCDTSAKVCTGSDTQTARDAASSGQALLPVYYGGLAVAAAGLAVGAYLVLTSDGPASTTVSLGPGRVTLRGTF